MALAWKILSFAAELDLLTKTTVFKDWWHSHDLYQIKAPEQAQRLWLDKILELAIQAEEILPD